MQLRLSNLKKQILIFKQSFIVITNIKFHGIKSIWLKLKKYLPGSAGKLLAKQNLLDVIQFSSFGQTVLEGVHDLVVELHSRNKIPSS